jgi:hypothetical protein
LELVGLALLIRKCFNSGSGIVCSHPPIIRKGEKKMSAIVKKYPVLSMLLLAMIIGFVPALAVAAGLLPPSWIQLGALSSSLAAVVLVVIEGRKGGLRELLGRVLIWRVGIQWWTLALFFMIVPTVASLYLYHLLGGPTVDWSGLPPPTTVY